MQNHTTHTDTITLKEFTESPGTSVPCFFKCLQSPLLSFWAPLAWIEGESYWHHKTASLSHWFSFIYLLKGPCVSSFSRSETVVGFKIIISTQFLWQTGDFLESIFSILIFIQPFKVKWQHMRLAGSLTAAPLMNFKCTSTFSKQRASYAAGIRPTFLQHSQPGFEKKFVLLPCW